MKAADIRLRKLLERAKGPDGLRPALTNPHGESLTYRELQSRVERAAHRLRDLGVGPGRRVAIALPNSIACVTWLLAVFETGSTAVPLDPRLRPDEQRLALDGSGASVLLCAREGWSADGEWTLTPADFAQSEQRLFLRRGSPAHQLADGGELLVHMTSGSSGHPKRIARPEHQIAEDCSHLAQALNLDQDDRFLAVLPFHHAYGGNGLLASIATGGQHSIQLSYGCSAELL